MPGRHVHDREAPVAKSDRPVDPQALPVGAAVAQHVAHALEPRLVDRLRRVELDDTGDAAHERRYAAFEPRMRIGSSKSSTSRNPLD